MEQEWKQAARQLSGITVSANPNNEPVTISGIPTDMRCVGVGTDAAVFQSIAAPDVVFKVYAKEKQAKVETEKAVYEQLGNSHYFPVFHAAADNYIVISYEEGITLFDCLLQGVYVPEQAIQDVEDARAFVRERGLNPRDIHLKNILLQNGRAKIIDVSEYILPGNDFRWEHLKKAYEEYYQLLEGRPVPFWLLETIRKWYNHWNRYADSYEEFMKHVYRHTTFRK